MPHPKYGKNWPVGRSSICSHSGRQAARRKQAARKASSLAQLFFQFQQGFSITDAVVHVLSHLGHGAFEPTHAFIQSCALSETISLRSSQRNCRRGMPRDNVCISLHNLLSVRTKLPPPPPPHRFLTMCLRFPTPPPRPRRCEEMRVNYSLGQ